MEGVAGVDKTKRMAANAAAGAIWPFHCLLSLAKLKAETVQSIALKSSAKERERELQRITQLSVRHLWHFIINQHEYANENQIK